MAMTQSDIAPYLLARGLVSAKSIVDEDFIVRDASRRNRNFQVVIDHGPCYLLKQGMGREGTAGVAHEAVMYELLQRLSMANALTDLLPHYHVYDADDHVLVVEFFRGGQDLRDYHTARGRFPVSLASAVGVALARLHRLTAHREVLDAIEPQLGQGSPPWTLSFHRPRLHTLLNLSAASVLLTKVVQSNEELSHELDELRRGWRRDVLIHGDLRWDNCIVLARAKSARTREIRLVDWESATIGDPAWDVAAFLCNYLSLWVMSIPMTADDVPDRLLDFSPYPLSKMQPAMLRFWHAYSREIGLDLETAEECFSRVIKYIAAMLIHTAFEQMQTSPVLTGNAVCLVQLAQNIFRRPIEARTYLLGIPPQRISPQ